jgi:DNA-directed RNA polymerase sigma subunit (sigma70/sigma32)
MQNLLSATEKWFPKGDEKLRMRLGKVGYVLKVAKEPLSLESPVGDEDDLRLGDFIQDENALSRVDASINPIYATQ